MSPLAPWARGGHRQTLGDRWAAPDRSRTPPASDTMPSCVAITQRSECTCHRTRPGNAPFWHHFCTNSRTSTTTWIDPDVASMSDCNGTWHRARGERGCGSDPRPPSGLPVFAWARHGPAGRAEASTGAPLPRNILRTFFLPLSKNPTTRSVRLATCPRTFSI